MRLLVPGGAGMLGCAIVRCARAAGHEPIAMPRAELDIVDAAAVAAAVRSERPDAVVNCAAFTDVDGAESDPDAAAAVNVAGAENVAAAAAAVGASVVYPSSDYVFDGHKDAPYVESDATGPLSEYGRSKLAGEQRTAGANPKHLLVRSSWLFGPGGRNFVETMLAASARGRLQVVDDQVGSPTYTVDLARAIIAIVAAGRFGLVHVAGGGDCSWHGFAREIFSQAKLEVELRACTTAEFPRPAPRPAYSVLRSERPDTPALRDWRGALADYLAERDA